MGNTKPPEIGWPGEYRPERFWPDDDCPRPPDLYGLSDDELMALVKTPLDELLGPCWPSDAELLAIVKARPGELPDLSPLASAQSRRAHRGLGTDG